MASAAEHLIGKGVPAGSVYVSTERNMQCAVGHCGHCQMGSEFICREGPVYAYPRVKHLLNVAGV
jgi:NAD(P)H-flavin reductase